MTIKILIFVLCLIIYVYVVIKIIIKIYKGMKREDEIIEQLIMELVWSQQRQENIEVLEQQRQEILPKHCIVPSGDYVATAGMPNRGKWVDVSERGSWSIKNACDQCGEVVFQPNYNYCPNCGVKMEVEE